MGLLDAAKRMFICNNVVASNDYFTSLLILNCTRLMHSVGSILASIYYK